MDDTTWLTVALLDILRNSEVFCGNNSGEIILKLLASVVCVVIRFVATVVFSEGDSNKSFIERKIILSFHCFRWDFYALHCLCVCI